MPVKIVSLLAVAVLGYAAAAGVPAPGASAPSGAAWFTLRGKVVRVVDGDTVHVRVGRRVEKVRLIGIDAPELGACYSPQSTAAMRRFVSGRVVVLAGDRTQSRRDVYGRLLAYVVLTSGVDVGRMLLRQGFAELYETSRPFARLRAYEAAAREAATRGAGLNGACARAVPPSTTTTIATGTTTTRPAPVPVAPIPQPPSNCAASYVGVCIPPPPPDLDCGDIPYRRFSVRHDVASPDPHRFDGDRDGVGCES